nr:MAG TPA: hypothetical protein [Caudoviricetes sp.]
MPVQPFRPSHNKDTHNYTENASNHPFYPTM